MLTREIYDILYSHLNVKWFPASEVYAKGSIRAESCEPANCKGIVQLDDKTDFVS